jgi:Cyanate lyase C-terminal domain
MNPDDPGGADHECDHFRHGDRTLAHPKGDRVKLTLSGKFLPYKEY